MVEEYIRKPTLFEKLLLVIGIVVVIVGYGLIHKLILIKNVMSWDLVISIFLWLIMILLIIITAVAENVKEEISFIVKKDTQFLKLLREKNLK